MTTAGSSHLSSVFRFSLRSYGNRTKRYGDLSIGEENEKTDQERQQSDWLCHSAVWRDA